MSYNLHNGKWYASFEQGVFEDFS